MDRTTLAVKKQESKTPSQTFQATRSRHVP